MLAKTKNQDGKKQRENESIAYFFLAQHRLIQGDRDGAREYLQKTVESGVTYYRQYAAAKIELKRIGN